MVTKQPLGPLQYEEGCILAKIHMVTKPQIHITILENLIKVL